MEKVPNRFLAAIMFTDMVGFTALMQRDEKIGLQKRARHREVMEQQHERYNGRIIRYFGDGTLSIFTNSCDAVECGIEIQKALKTPVEVPLRIGIHVGNVMLEADALIGDAVNIASRIESFANIGGVLISDSVQDQVRNQAQWGFVPLGKFKLKNVERPFEIFAVESEGIAIPDPGFLRGKGEKIAALKSNIPNPATPLLGRGQELAAVIQLLEKQQVVSIIGPGGVGKTRLSLEVCRSMAPEFKDGIAFVSMATLTEAREVMPTLTAALDVKEAEGRELLDGVVAMIADKKALLVLDNLEQIISAAKEIAALVARCPNLKILCTSRTPLKIKAEQAFELHPLPLPEQFDWHSLLEYPAIQLFLDRAQKANMDFELSEENAEAIYEICRRLDGLPLALELAAARVRILPPEKLLSRLGRALDLLTTGDRDLPERHQTLRATIDWSHDLLNKAEQQLFRRLSVFAGSFTLEAVEEVCYENEEDAFLALDELESLLDKGLVVKKEGNNRFGQLQMINDFGKEQLKANGETDRFYQNHAKYYCKIATTIKEGVQGNKQLMHLELGAQEESNIQVALDFLLRKAVNGYEEAREMGLFILGELYMYWHIRGKHHTGNQYITSFLESTENQEVTIGKCKALFHLHVATFSIGEFETTKAVSEKNYVMAEILEDDLEIAKAAFGAAFGNLFFDLAATKNYSDECVARFRKLENDSWLAFALWQSGLVNLIGGDLEKAKACQSESFELFKKIKDYEGIGCARSALAMLDFIAGDSENALEKYQEALVAFQSVGDRPEEARVYSEMSWTYLAKNDTISARKYTLNSIQAYQEVGSTRGIGLSLNALAAIEAVEGRPQRALEIAAAAKQFAEQEGIVIEFGANNHGQIYLDKAKKQLSQQELEDAKIAGRSMSLKEVIAIGENEAIMIM